MNKNNIKYPFPTAAIFLFISSFFYFISLILCDELPYIAADLTVPCFLRFISVITLGIFLLIKKVPLGTLISIGVLLLAQIIDWIIFSDVFQYYLYADSEPLIFLQNLLILCTLVFIFLLALTNLMNNGFVKLTKAWFVGIILSALAYFIDLIAYAYISEMIPTEIEDVIIGNFLGNIFICVAFCLMPRWFRDVANAKMQTEEQPLVFDPSSYGYIQEDMPVYDPYLYLEKQQPAEQPEPSQKIDDQIEALRKYKSLYDEGLITEEEYNAKKVQILNL